MSSFDAGKHGYTSRLQAVLNDLGLLYLDLADFQTATQHFIRSLRVATEIGDRDAGIIASCNLGLVNERQRKDRASGELFQECLNSAERVGTPDLAIGALEGLATIYGRQGQHKLALTYCDRTLQTAKELGDRPRQPKLAWRKAAVYFDLRD